MFDSLIVATHAFRESTRYFASRAELQHYQQKLARHHLSWVIEHSSATARRFERAGLGLDDWQQLPPTNKSEMMASFDQLNTVGLTLTEALAFARQAEQKRDFGDDLRGITVGLSTGTSGNQGIFVTNRQERLLWAGIMLRHLLPNWPRSLLKPQRVAFVLRAEGGLYRSVESRSLHFQFFDLLRPISQLAKELTLFDPTLLVGPPSVLCALQQSGALARPERVICVAEVLEDDDKTLLEAYFGPVVQVYQATEGLLGLPCPEGYLHLNEAHVHFDFEPLSDSPYCRPIVTDLRRRVQPIIRHRLDDILLLAPEEDICPCGSVSRRILRVVGRQDDALKLPSAKSANSTITVWPDFMRAALAKVAALQEYRLIQTDSQELLLELIPFTNDVVCAAEKEIRQALRGNGVRDSLVTIKSQEWQPLPAGSKRRRVQRL